MTDILHKSLEKNLWGNYSSWVIANKASFIWSKASYFSIANNTLNNTRCCTEQIKYWCLSLSLCPPFLLFSPTLKPPFLSSWLYPTSSLYTPHSMYFGPSNHLPRGHPLPVHISWGWGTHGLLQRAPLLPLQGQRKACRLCSWTALSWGPHYAIESQFLCL